MGKEVYMDIKKVHPKILLLAHFRILCILDFVVRQQNRDSLAWCKWFEALQKIICGLSPVHGPCRSQFLQQQFKLRGGHLEIHDEHEALQICHPG